MKAFGMSIRNCLPVALILLLASGSFTGFAWAWPKRSTVEAEGRRYYDVYMVNNQMCRQCAVVPVNEYQMGLINRAGQSVVVRSVDIVGVDNHPRWRKLLEGIVSNTGIVGRTVAAPGYDPLQSWRDEIRERPAPSPVNYPHE